MTANATRDPSRITIDEVMKSLKTQQRDERFKKTLLSQRQEIDNTLEHLKTKILKLVQIYNKSTKSHQEHDILHSAAVCTQRFHRAVRKALIELSHVNDRVVRDYVYWKKKTEELIDNQHRLEKLRECKDKRQKEQEEKLITR
jgi:phosphotransacetylase